MAEIDKNPKQICFMRHQTQKMLENLVFVNDDDTTQLTLDPDNISQGYISYYRPTISESSTDDYFNFGSASVDVRLPLTTDGVILVNNSGKEHLYNVVMNTLIPNGYMNIQFPYGSELVDLDKYQAWARLKIYLSNLHCLLPATGITKVNGHFAIITDVGNLTDVNKLTIDAYDLVANTTVAIELNKVDFDINDVKSIPIN